MKCEIDIDLGKLSDEWEPVAFRVAKKGETIVCQNGLPHLIQSDSWNDPRLIVRRRWQWPEWLTAEWYCEWQNGSQYVSVYEPLLVSGRSDWLGNGTMKCLDGVVDIPKIGGDWRQSKRRNPRSK